MTSDQTQPAVPIPPHHHTPPHYLDVHGVPTAYRRDGGGAPVVFLHGAGSTRMWLPMYARLAERFDFIAPEHPGFGATPRPEWLENFSDLVIHYDEFLARLGVDRIHLIGWSLGGWIAAEFASFFPRRVASLTLITPIGLRVPDDPGVDLFKLMPEELMAVLFNDPATRAHYAGAAPSFEEQCQIHAEMSTLAKLIWAPRYNLALEWRLKRVQCPALIVKAEDDRLIPGAMADRYAAILPNARTVVIPETGHALCLERPDAVAAAISAFLGEHVHA